MYDREVFLLHFDPREAATSKTNKAFERDMEQANDDDILSISRKAPK